MNALGDLAIEPFHFRGRLEGGRLVLGVFAGARFRLVRAGSRNARKPLEPLVLGLFPGQTFGDLGFQVVEHRVAQSDKMQIAPFERAQFSAEIRRTQFSLG